MHVITSHYQEKKLVTIANSKLEGEVLNVIS